MQQKEFFLNINNLFFNLIQKKFRNNKLYYKVKNVNNNFLIEDNFNLIFLSSCLRILKMN